ncbi:hypothetical protein PHYC_03457 [Phycisphaerales bacterium]|nr:hypothetical protein PHYC_03457 [Phycisphaerales bacterium]
MRVAGRIGVVVLVLLAAAGAPAALASWWPVPSFRAPARSPLDDAIRTLRDAAAPDGVRQAAAGYLITQSDASASRAALADELAKPLTAGAGGFVLRAIAAASDVSPRLYPMLAQRVSRSNAAELPRVLEALGSFRSRDAARLLVLHLDESQPEAVRTAAAGALARLSGHDDFADDPTQWGRWLSEVDGLSELQWRASLVASFARRVDRLDAERRAAGAKVVEVLRRLHLATPPEQRSAFLAGLLTDSSREVRDLGLELVSRELSASGTLGPEVGDAAIPLLASEDSRVRAAAAGIVRQLAPAQASPAISRALRIESDPSAAGALLIAATRWPSEAVVQVLLRWLDINSPARDKATDAAWQLYRAGELNSTAQQEVLDAVRRSMSEHATPAACGLLAALGNSEDLATIVPLLDSPDAAMRIAAADALVWSPEHQSAILAAAAKDADLFDAAARAVLVHDPTATGLRALLSLPRPSQEIADAAIARVAIALPANDLWDVASHTTDSVLQTALLRRLATPERFMSEWTDPGQRDALTSGLLAYAGSLIDNNAPAEALSLFEYAASVGLASPKPLTDLKCAALVALGRLDEADALNTGPAPWFRGLSLALTKPHAPAVLKRIDDRFTQDLNDEQKQVLQTVRAALAKPANGNGSNGAPPR